MLTDTLEKLVGADQRIGFLLAILPRHRVEGFFAKHAARAVKDCSADPCSTAWVLSTTAKLCKDGIKVVCDPVCYWTPTAPVLSWIRAWYKENGVHHENRVNLARAGA